MPEPLLTTVSLNEALAHALRDRILSGDIAPGTPLPELEVGATYGVARPTVRAALQTLVAMGLLRREPNRSAYIPELSRDDIVDLFFVRRRLECEAVRLLVARAVRPAPAEQAVRRLEGLGPRSEWSAVVEADLAFHLALIDGVGSPRLVRVYALLANEIRLTLAQLRPSYDSPATLAAEHRVLLDVIGGGDAERAVDLLEAHLDHALASLTAARSA